MSADDHGSASTYTNHDCRCQACRAAWSAYVRDRKARRRHDTAARPRAHGSASTYSNWGCRCEPCVTAYNEYRRDLYARKSGGTSTNRVPAWRHGPGYGCGNVQCAACYPTHGGAS